MKKICLLSLLAALSWTAAAQDPGPHPPFVSSPRRILVPPELLDAPDEWIDRSLQWVESILEQYPPGNPETPVRRAALYRLDDILHIKSAPAKPLVQQYYRMRMERAVADIAHTKVTEGMRIWKLYNHGFLVRTPTVSFTFDIVPGTREPGFAIPKELLQRLADQSDATFISHLHGDHANQEVARIFLDKRKPVIAPEGLWSDVPELAAKLTYPKRSVSEVHDIPIQSGQRVLKVVSYPGHQGKTVLVNVNLVTTPEGFTVVQTGDQSGAEGPGSDFDWLAQIGRDHHVDVLMPNAWANGLQRIVRGVNPELVITGHENEMGHAVDHREDYTQTYTHLFGAHYPFLVMTWGESYWYQGPQIPPVIR